MKKIELSVIIVNFNTKKLLKDCIDSIIKYKKDLKIEVIVIDNGSKEKIDDLSFKISNYSLIQNNTNQGFSVANNQGIKAAKGRFILLLNSDTKVKEGAIQNLLEFAKQAPNSGVVGARLLNKDGSTQSSCLNFPTLLGAINQYWLKSSKKYDKYAPKSDKPTKVDAVVGAAFLITPEALEKVGLLDERYFFFFEDLDYCRRAKKQGLDVWYLPSAEIVHYHGASGTKITNKANQWRRLIPSSKIYHGILKYYLIYFVMWTSQKIWRN